MTDEGFAPSPSRTKIVGDGVPDGRFNIPSRRAGPACPAEKCVPGGGTHGSRPTGAYPPKKNNEAPLAGRLASLSKNPSFRNRFRRNFHILDRCTKFGGELL